jgi:hypothetical protein
LLERPTMAESAVMAVARQGGPPVIPLPVPEMPWEEQVTNMLKLLEERLQVIDSKVAILNAQGMPPPTYSPTWYLSSLHRGITLITPYLISGYIAMQLLSKLKK